MTYRRPSLTPALCLAAPLLVLTLVASGSSAQWLWADAKHLAYGGHLRVGTLAVARAANNPF